MASATLNSNLMEALVNRPVEARRVNVHSNAQEGCISPPTSSSPPGSDTTVHNYLHRNSFGSSYSHYLVKQESHDNSTSGGDASTEDEETSENPKFFYKRTADEASHNSSLKKRRKQMKPIRVSSFEEKCENPSTSEKINFLSEMSREEPDETIRCPHCPLDTTSEDELRHHIIEDHLGRMLTEEGIKNSYNSLRETNEHLSGRNFSYQDQEEGELVPLNLSSPKWNRPPPPPPPPPRAQSRENGDRSPEVSLPPSLHVSPTYTDKFGLPSLVPLGPPPFLLPFLQQHQNSQNDRDRLHPTQQPLRPVSNGQTQIFNLEAYCDLCNKEFCNKYFLKTHKANKHGVINADICTSQLDLSTPIAPTCSPPSLIQSSVSMSASFAPLSLQTSPLNSLPLSGSSFAGAFIAANMSNLPLRPLMAPHLHGLQKSPQLQQQSMQKIDQCGSSVSKNGIVSIEAYCEICQKEFCNKYFLKRHKSKIHNIDIEVTIKNTSKNPLSLGKLYDRPDGWCDACRRNVGSKNDLNNHKLNAHGPHIIVPLTSSPKCPENISDSRESMKANAMSSSNENINDNFSPWDQKREEAARNMEASRSENSILYDQERVKYLKIERERNEENEKDKKEYWNEMERNDRKWRQDSLEKESPSPNYLNSPPEEDKLTTCLAIKQELQQYSDDQSIKSLNTNKRSPELDVEREFPMHQLSEILKQHNYGEKTKAQNEAAKCSTEDRRNDENSLNEITSEQPRTPGAGSSNDENSREQGLFVNRIGKIPNIPILPGGAKLSHEQLRQLGVVNPDAFCELCCKEFCNKYFLRTHKVKKHGIITPEFSDRSRQIKEQNSSLNLVQFLNSGFQDMETDIECETCQRQFPNPYMLHMHKFYAHGRGPELWQHEQVLQLQQQQQQQPIQQDHIRQLAALHIQQQTLQTHMKRSLSSPSKSNSDLLNEQIALQSITQASKILFPDVEDNITKVFLSRPNSENSSTNLPQLSPCEMSSRNNTCSESPQEPDTSEDLKKLQSMIQDLHRCEDGGSRCKMCQQDLGTKYLLRAHLMTDHGIFPKNDASILSSESHTPKTSREGTPISSVYSTPVNDGQGFCNICKKDFYAKYLLQQHTIQIHGIFTPHSAPSFIERIKAEIDSRDERKAISTSRSYCEICNKELCNKYFMKTHMQKMHNINVENQTPGGVICDICQKPLCSKYFLRVHKQNTHGLIEEHGENDIYQHENGTSQICPICSRRFKTMKWLQTHLNTDHGELGKEKWKEIEKRFPICDSSQQSNLHPCNLCGQQLHDLVALQIHKIQSHGISLKDLNGIDFTHINKEEKQNLKPSILIPNLSTAHSMYEKSHTSPTLSHSISNFLPSPAQLFQCKICSHVLPTVDLYQQHLMHHQMQALKPMLFRGEDIPSIIDQPLDRTFEAEVNQPTTATISAIEKKETTTTTTPLIQTPKKRWKCYTCGFRFRSKNLCVMHVQMKHKSKSYVDNAICRRRLFKCKVCGGTAKSKKSLRKHIKSRHSSVLNGVLSNQVQPRNAEGEFVMQPFMLNKEDPESSMSDDQPFVPSLIYLPVAKKVDRPLKVSFSLTPAENKSFD